MAGDGIGTDVLDQANWALPGRSPSSGSGKTAGQGVQGAKKIEQWRVETVGAVDASDLMARARSGDGEAFHGLTGPYHRELLVHCYRMLGSFQDAEDALQDTMLAAWQRLDSFEGRSSLRTWLYRVATNKCLDARRSVARRRTGEWDVPDVQLPTPSRLGEVVWLQPFPDAHLDDITEPVLEAEARFERREAISLAFVTATQVLPPRQVAVLLLRDVLGFGAVETATILGTTVESVTSALKRARANLSRRWTPDHEREAPPPAPGSRAEKSLLARFVRAWESADVDALVALLTEDITMSMPPMPFEFQGRPRVAEFCGRLFGAGRGYDLAATRANGQPAFGAYRRGDHGVSRGTGLYVLSLARDRICAFTRFENTVMPAFGLPRSIKRHGKLTRSSPTPGAADSEVGESWRSRG